jgi:Amt family ammonium transporter
MIIEWLTTGKFTLEGIANGVICGLVGSSSTAGYVGIWEAMVIGAFSGIIGYIGVNMK